MTEKQKAVLAKTIGTICVCGFFLVLSRGLWKQKLAAIYDFLYLDEEQPLENEEDGETAWETEQPADWEDVPAESMPDAAEELEPIDLNQATLADLMQIPDMSEALAEQILALREEITAFQSVYELLYAEGMTTERWKAICPYVTVNP